jgi:hypothetical protein
MPRYLLSYSYVIPCSVEFTIDADSRKAAIAEARKALNEGKFNDVPCEPVWDAPSGHRVAVLGETSPARFSGPSLSELIN